MVHPLGQLGEHRIRIGLFRHEHRSLARFDHVDIDIDGPLTPVPELVGKPMPDMVLVNDDDLTFAKIRLDPQSVPEGVE